MKLISFLHRGRPSIGIAEGDAVVDLSDSGLPSRMEALIALGDAGLSAARKAAAAGAPRIPLSAIEWMAPVGAPAKAIAVGLNYVDHAIESNKPKPDYPVLFNRWPSSWVAHRQALAKPRASEQFDYEGELVVVIGKGGRDIDKARALDHVFGYSIFNEGSVRDYQTKSSQWMIGKNFDRSGGFGPWLVTADELPPGAAGLALRTELNGECMQQASTSDMIFDVATLVSLCSIPFALAPGDLIISGTPAGVGVSRNPQRFMRDGDLCEVSIEGIGTLSNRVRVGEPVGA